MFRGTMNSVMIVKSRKLRMIERPTTTSIECLENGTLLTSAFLKSPIIEFRMTCFLYRRMRGDGPLLGDSVRELRQNFKISVTESHDMSAFRDC
eukprot:741295-Hanusia_phi.AAC.3